MQDPSTEEVPLEPPTIRSVLVATALDDRSSGVLEEAAHLVEAAGAELHVLHVVEEGTESSVEEARARLDSRLEAALPHRTPASRSVRTGSARDAIIDRADDVSADVVVVGPNRRKGLKERILGGTAQAVIGDDGLPARTAVLVAGEAPEARTGSLLVAVDRSRWTPPVLAWGRAIAGLTDASITVLHAFRPMYGGAAGVVSGADARRRIQQEQLEQVERQVREEAAGAGVGGPDVSVAVESGDPAAVIAEEAERRAAGWIVMGSRGAGAAERALLGSVAGNVISSTRRSVLVVRQAAEGD